jgi:prepilin-type processing-associated H-X9-DG protein
LSGAAAGFVGLGIAVLVFIGTRGSEDTASQSEPEMTARIDVVPEPIVQPPLFEEPEPAEAPEELVVEVEVPASEVEIVDAVEPEGSVNSISEGLWILSVWPGDNQAMKVDFPNPIRFRLQGRNLYIESEDERGTVEPFGNGTILGRHVELFGLNGMAASLSGEFNAAFTQATLTGVLPEEMGSEGEPVSLTLAFRKMTEEDTNRLATIEELKEEVSELFAAIQKFRDDTGAFPLTLAELVPDYIDSLDAIRSTKERQIAYAPELFSEVGDRMSESDIVGPTATLHQDLEIPDRYMEMEWALEDQWDGRFLIMGKPGLSVSSPSLDVRITVNRSGRVQEASLNLASSGEDLSEAMLEMRSKARLESCQNNMKQLGLVIKIFQNEHEGSMTPSGWHSVFPEYLGGVGILTCPGGEAHTFGYELVFPATMPEFFDDLVTEVEGVTLEEVGGSRQFLSHIPIVIETGECNELGGRNVTFLDGHVELVRHEDWDAVVGPYLEFR